MRIQKIIFQRIIATGLLVAVSACGFDAEVRRDDLAPSQWALAQGFPTLSPIDDFAVERYEEPNAGNLVARAANLRRKIRALSGPVISNRDRTRILAAITRREQG